MTVKPKENGCKVRIWKTKLSGGSKANLNLSLMTRKRSEKAGNSQSKRNSIQNATTTE
jgi:hypothetical protein